MNTVDLSLDPEQAAVLVAVARGYGAAWLQTLQRGGDLGRDLLVGAGVQVTALGGLLHALVQAADGAEQVSTVTLDPAGEAWCSLRKRAQAAEVLLAGLCEKLKVSVG